MRAIIQAGGKGSRLRNITKNEIPKPMVPILGKPLLQWQIEQLRKENINEIFIIVGYLGESIKNYFKDGKEFGVSITYIKESMPLGTAGGLCYLKKYIQDNENIFLIYADLLFDIDFARMEEFHFEKKSKLTAFVHPNSHPFDSDIIELDSEQKITGILSKKKERKGWYGNLVNAGFYILNGKIIQELPNIQKLDFEKDILCEMIDKSDSIFGYRSTEYIKDAGTEKRLCIIENDIKYGYIGKRNLS